MLQAKAGYIDARPHIRPRDEVLLQRTAGPYLRELLTTESGKVQKYKLRERGVTDERTWDREAAHDRRTRQADASKHSPCQNGEGRTAAITCRAQRDSC
jgi:hypothetical protein